MLNPARDDPGVAMFLYPLRHILSPAGLLLTGSTFVCAPAGTMRVECRRQRRGGATGNSVPGGRSRKTGTDETTPAAV